MPGLSRSSREPDGNDVPDTEKPRDRYPGSVLEPHGLSPFPASCLTPALNCGGRNSAHRLTRHSGAAVSFRAQLGAFMFDPDRAV
jgi:hypothetical protein